MRNTRLKRYWIAVLLVLLAVGAVWYGIAYRLHHADQRDEIIAYYQGADEDPLKCMSSDVVTVLRCIQGWDDVRAERQHAAYELRVQQEMAEWAYAAVVVTALGIVFVALTLREARKTTEAAIKSEETMAKALAAELEPFLTLEFEEVSGLQFLNGRFVKKDGSEVKELWFRIRNSGRSPAVVKQICRRWSVISGSAPPAPVHIGPMLAGHSVADGVSFKQGSVPIGGGSESGRIRALIELLNNRPNVQDGRVYFQGFFVFEDLSTQRYASGFLLIFDDDRFHLAWPTSDHDRYNYHHRL